MRKNKENGFIAFIAVYIIALYSIFICLMTLNNVLDLRDIQSRREWRIQAEINANACRDELVLRYAKNYYISGQVYLADFGCKIDITNSLVGSISINGTTTFASVHGYIHEQIAYGQTI